MKNKREVKYCDYCSNILFNGGSCKKCDNGNSAVETISAYLRQTKLSSSDAIAQNILKIVRDMLPKMGESTKAADRHFTCAYEELDSLYQHEWEGISWGFQDCVTMINRKFGAEEQVRKNIKNLENKTA